jgi:hypothetical protein
MKTANDWIAATPREKGLIEACFGNQFGMQNRRSRDRVVNGRNLATRGHS